MPPAAHIPMKAFVYTRYGSPDVLRLEERPAPRPGPGQVLIKVRAVALNAADWRLLRADPFLARFFAGLLAPKPRLRVLGADVAGTVEAVGPGVARLRPGDEVYGDLANHGFGGLAEYACPPERAVATKPPSLSFEEAAAVPLAGMTALQGLRDLARVEPGQKVLVHGASGGVGTYAVQVAKALGAEITAVCSTGKVELVRSLGAAHVIDYTREDFTRSGLRYDVIFAANGYRSIFDYRRSLAPRGRYVMAGGTWPQMRQAMLWGPLLSSRRGRRLAVLSARSTPEDLEALKDLVARGQLRPVIDRRFAFADTREAFRYLEAGHAAGKVVIRVEPAAGRG
jgi:NADPH:quinone reductase-like Zn-dependent oxidoreductase